jgi:Rrf2 family protein
MRVSAKAEYACIAMLELTVSYGSGEPVQIRKIADRHGIPSRFLVQILLQLKGAGYVNSTRGASGGYELVRDPHEVSLAEVLQIIEGPDETAATNASPESSAARVLQDCWQEVSAMEQQILRNITFADLLERARRQNEAMYYI